MPDDPFGLGDLTDDQLVEMARQIGAEINRRNPAVADAASAAIRAEIEKVRNSQDAQWAQKKWLGKMMVDHLGPGWQITVWTSDHAETRVYMETPNSSKKNYLKYCLYITGNSRQPPGSLTLDAGSNAMKADSQLLRIIAAEAVRLYPGGVRIACDQAAASKYAVPPEPPELAERIAQIRAEKDAAEARANYQREVTEREMAAFNAEKTKAERDLNGASWHALPFNDTRYTQLVALSTAANDRIRAAMAEYDARIAETAK